MMTTALLQRDRRAFLRFLAGSPYIAALGGVRAAAFQPQPAADVIADPKDALDVMDFEEAAHHKVGAGHWAYMASGVDDDLTLKANREGFKHVQLRPRRLVDATKVDIRTELWGTMYNSPVFLCPTGGEDVNKALGRPSLVSALRAFLVDGHRKAHPSRGSGWLPGCRADGRQHHRQEQPDL
jgi:4-hydroxymandelate oxidase